MTFKAASKNLTNENDEFKKRCDHDECLAHTLVFWFLLGARATEKLDAMEFSSPLVRSAYYKSSIYLQWHKKRYRVNSPSAETYNKEIFKIIWQHSRTPLFRPHPIRSKNNLSLKSGFPHK